jgi:hypothetical protein
MRTITAHIRRFAILFTIMTVALAALPLAASAQDTTDDQKELCKNGGWQTLTRADGTPFTNQGECVKYIASEGGTFGSTEEPQEPPVDPTPPGGPSSTVTLYNAYEWGCDWSLDLSGFPAETEFVVYADEAGVELDPLYGHYVAPFTIVTDANGTFHLSQEKSNMGLDGLTSYVFTVSQGETVVAQHTVWCGWDGNGWIEQS